MTAISPPAPLIRDAAWSGHHLLFDPATDVVERKLRRPQLSPSVASGYNSCPARTAADRLMPFVEDPFAANEMGTNGHAVLEDLMDPAGDPSLRTRERAQELLIARADEVWAVSKLARHGKQELAQNARNREEWLSTISGWIDGYFAIENPQEVEVYAVELLLDNLLIGAGIGGPEGIPLKGFVDRTDLVVVSGEKKLAVKDYKFGKPHLKPDLRFGDNYGDQQRTYVAGFYEKTGQMPASADLIYPRGPGVRAIDISNDAMRKTLLGFRAGWDTMNQSADRRAYEARPSGLCSWCPLVNSCPVANTKSQKANAVEARQKAPSALQLGIPTLRPNAAPAEVPSAPPLQVPRQEPAAEPQAQEAPAPALEQRKPAEQAVETVEQQSIIPQEVIDNPRGEAIPPRGDDLFPITIVGDASPSTAVHTSSEDENSPSPSTGESPSVTEVSTMSENQIAPQAEAVPYEETANGRLNLNSYAAGATSGIVSLAFQTIMNAGVKGNPANTKAMANVLAGIVLRAQRQITGEANFQRGASTRLRGFLHTYIEHRPAPFGGTAEAWQTWIARAEAFLIFGVSAAIELWDENPVNNGAYLAFVGAPAAPTPYNG